MNRAITAIAAAALLALGGCSKKVDNPPAPPAGSAAAPAPAAGSGSAASGTGSAAPAAGTGSAASGTGSAAATAAVEVPTEMDFEDDATAKITDKNVETEVKALEKELDAK